jgi:tetratricopeptide (TPR) repeat protein
MTIKLLKKLFIILIFLISTGCYGQLEDSIYYWKNQLNRDLDVNHKANYLYKLAAEYWYSNTDSSLYYSSAGLAYGQKQIKPELWGRLLFSRAIAFTNLGHSDSAFFYLQNAENLFKLHGFDYMRYRVMEQQGCLYRETGNYDSAVRLLEEAAVYFRKTEDVKQINSVLINLGNTFLDRNQNVKALQYYNEASKYDTLLNDPAVAGMTKLGTAVVYMNLGKLFQTVENDKSDEYFKHCIRYLLQSYNSFSEIKHQTGMCYVRMNLMEVFVSMNRLKEADSIYQVSNSCLFGDDTRIIMSLRTQKARMLYKLGESDHALILLNAIDALRSKLIIPAMFNEAMMLKAKILHERGHNEMAYPLADSAISWFRAHHVTLPLYESLMELSAWQQADSKFKEALFTSHEASIVLRGLFEDASHEIFNEIALRYENKVLSTKLQLTEVENNLEYTRFRVIMLIGGIVLLALATSLGILFWRRNKTRLLKEIAEQKTHGLELENLSKSEEIEIIRLEKQLQEELAERYQLDAQLREQELVFQSLKQAQLSQLNNSIREKFTPFKHRMTRKKDQEVFEQTLEEVCREMARDPLADFEQIFSQMHSGFYEKLLEKNNGLSRSELQICALLRLNLPSKEIANLLYITMASVDQKRHQIRKKLSLETNQSLIGFLINL